MCDKFFRSTQELGTLEQPKTKKTTKNGAEMFGEIAASNETISFIISSRPICFLHIRCLPYAPLASAEACESCF
jgi:hypothetical protein